MPSVQESAFSASGQDVLRYPVESDSHEFVPELPHQLNADSLNEWNHQYEVDKISNWVSANQFEKVLSDYLLKSDQWD